MGTRGIYGFRINGEDKVTYNQFDTYLDGLGLIMCTFVADTPAKKLKTIAEDIVLVSLDTKPTKEQIAICRDFADLSVSERTYEDWYCLLRNAQNNPEAYRDTGLIYMIDSHWFLADSLFCEWAYIANIDEDILEFYTGYNKDPKAPGRYAASTKKSEAEYYGVRHIVDIPMTWFRRRSYRKINRFLKNKRFFDFMYGDECQKSFFRMTELLEAERPLTRPKHIIKTEIKDIRKRRKLRLGDKRITVIPEGGTV